MFAAGDKGCGTGLGLIKLGSGRVVGDREDHNCTLVHTFQGVDPVRYKGTSLLVDMPRIALEETEYWQIILHRDVLA